MNVFYYSCKQTKPQKAPLQNKTKKNQSDKWMLKLQPSLCLLVSKACTASALQRQRSPALESSMLPWPGSGLAEVSGLWRKQGGQMSTGTYRCAGKRS